MPVKTHVIIVFDCCRGKKCIEMGSGPNFQLTVKPSELCALKNADFKNSYILHATLPHQVLLTVMTKQLLYYQVAYYEDDNNCTKFSKYFSEALEQNPPIDIGNLDEFINSQLDAEDGSDTKGFKQMVQLDKRVNKPFKW